METAASAEEKIHAKKDIDYAFMFNGFTLVVMSNGSHEVVDLPLSRIEGMLKSRCFFRIHRSYLVNMKRVKEMVVRDNKLMIRIRGQELPVSRRKRKILLKMLPTVN